nr:MAG TPA: hypothetical protein [Caudoviricetes sp.]
MCLVIEYEDTKLRDTLERQRVCLIAQVSILALSYNI